MYGTGLLGRESLYGTVRETAPWDLTPAVPGRTPGTERSMSPTSSQGARLWAPWLRGPAAPSSAELIPLGW
jgi:hypothetical protein